MRYLIHAAFLNGGLAEATSVREQLRAELARPERSNEVIERLELTYGHFDPHCRLLRTPNAHFDSRDEYSRTSTT